MNISLREKKKKAVELMNKLGLRKSVIEDFEKNDKIPFYMLGSWHKLADEVLPLIKDIQFRYDCLVYAVTKEPFPFGMCYSLLIIPDYHEDWFFLCSKYDEIHFSTPAYVFNDDKPHCSEFGSILLQKCNGNILRVG